MLGRVERAVGAQFTSNSPRKGSSDLESDMGSRACGGIGVECIESMHREGARGLEMRPVVCTLG